MHILTSIFLFAIFMVFVSIWYSILYLIFYKILNYTAKIPDERLYKILIIWSIVLSLISWVLFVNNILFIG